MVIAAGRRRAVAAAFALTATLCGALLATTAGGDYVGPFPAATPVARVAKAPVNDQLVVVRGHLVRRLGLELYLLRDGSGEITVEIDPSLFPRGPVRADTPVEVRGRVETGWRDGARIEAHSLTVLPSPPREGDREAPAKPVVPEEPPAAAAPQPPAAAAPR